MAKILRVKSITSPRTPKRTSTVGQDAIEKSFHDPSVLTGKTTKKRGVRRLMPHNPMTNPMERDVVDQFSNNPNVKFDNSKAPGSVRKVRIPFAKTVGRGTAGHQKKINYNNQQRTGGKNLRRF